MFKCLISAIIGLIGLIIVAINEASVAGQVIFWIGTGSMVFWALPIHR